MDVKNKILINKKEIVLKISNKKNSQLTIYVNKIKINTKLHKDESKCKNYLKKLVAIYSKLLRKIY